MSSIKSILLFIFMIAGFNLQSYGEDFYPAGVWYGGGKVRAPMLSHNPGAEREAWKKDLLTIRSLGFNSVKCWVDWASAEPQSGQYRFDCLEQLLDLADETELRVIVQIYADSAPEWVTDSYPEARFVTSEGRIIPSQAAPGFSLDHPGVRTALENFIEEAGKIAKAHKSFYAWDLWSEPHLVNWVWFNNPVQFGFNPFTQERFREWLKQKYGSLDVLNRAWYRTFSRWDQVEAPRFGTILSYTDFIDWNTFIAVKLKEDLKRKAVAARRADPNCIVSSHSDAPSALLSPLSGYGSPDDWWMAQSVDYYGTSIYPKHASSTSAWNPIKLTMALDSIRSAGGENGWWMGELQAGQGVTGVRAGAHVNAADLRLWGWLAMSRGVRSISYYAWYPMSSGYESNGYGMIELDGLITERARAAGQLAKIITDHHRVFSSLRPMKSDVAILYNRLAYMTGGNTVAPGQVVRDSLMGFYRALFERNIQVDFIHPDQILSGRANEYKVIYLPYPLMLQESVAKALIEYTRQGGTLISEARPAWNDDRGFANERIPGAGLDEVFGCREKMLESGETVDLITEEKLPGMLAPLGDRIINGILYAQHLTLTSPQAKALAYFQNGDPAIVLSPFGKGQAMLIGTFPAAAYERERITETGLMLQRITAWAGVEPVVEIHGAQGCVEARLLESEKRRLFIGINHTEQKQNVEFQLPPETSSGRAVNLETGNSFSLENHGNGPTFTYRFEPRDVLALLFD